MRKAVGRYQATFRTPLAHLPAFVAPLLGAAEPHRFASVTIEQVVFEPKNLHALLPTVGLEAIRRDTVITTVGPHPSEQLLRAALADWGDFFLVPVPQQYVLYADHDEYLTIFAATKSVVSSVSSVVRSAGFAQVSRYQRNWSTVTFEPAPLLGSGVVPPNKRIPVDAGGLWVRRRRSG